jgi:GTPase SAR1 family protein
VAINPITNKDSFINTVRWLNEIKEQANNHICITLVGNKSDLEAHRSVKAEEAREFAYSNELLFIEASALSGFNVEKTFTIGIAQILNKLENGDIDMTKDHTGIRMGTTLKKKVCCG